MTEKHDSRLDKLLAQMATGFIPPWQDMAVLCLCISATPHTVEKWVVEGILPRPRPRGGKQMWKWTEVDEMLSGGSVRSPDAEADRIRNGTRRAAETRVGH